MFTAVHRAGQAAKEGAPLDVPVLGLRGRNEEQGWCFRVKLRKQRVEERTKRWEEKDSGESLGPPDGGFLSPLGST